MSLDQPFQWVMFVIATIGGGLFLYVWWNHVDEVDPDPDVALSADGGISGAQRLTIVTTPEHHEAIIEAICRDYSISGDIKSSISGSEVSIEFMTIEAHAIASMTLLRLVGADVHVHEAPEA